MRGRFVKGIMVGSMIGIGAGAVISGKMNRRTKRKIRKFTDTVKGTACDLYGGCMDRMK